MKHSVFSTSMKVLIVTLILLAVCLPNDRSQYFMAGAAVIWLIIVLGCYLFKRTRGLRHLIGHQLQTSWSQFQLRPQPIYEREEPVAEEIVKQAGPAAENNQTDLTQEEYNAVPHRAPDYREITVCLFGSNLAMAGYTRIESYFKRPDRAGKNRWY